jgi:lambda repressor-like predicted transcriptional regulator
LLLVKVAVSLAPLGMTAGLQLPVLVQVLSPPCPVHTALVARAGAGHPALIIQTKPATSPAKGRLINILIIIACARAG